MKIKIFKIIWKKFKKYFAIKINLIYEMYFLLLSVFNLKIPVKFIILYFILISVRICIIKMKD